MLLRREEDEEDEGGEMQLQLGVPDVAVAVGRSEVECGMEEAAVLAGVTKYQTYVEGDGQQDRVWISVSRRSIPPPLPPHHYPPSYCSSVYQPYSPDIPVQIPSLLPTSQLPSYQHVYLSHPHQLAPVLVFLLARVQNDRSSWNTVHCDPRIPDSEMPVAELELLEIARVLCFAVGGTVKDEEEEKDLLLHSQHNRREQCLLRVGAQGQYCWHGYARGEEALYQNLDVHNEYENLLLRVDREDLAAELELGPRCLIEPEEVAGLMGD